MDFLLDRWPSILINLFIVLIDLMVIRVAFIQFFIYKTLHEDINKWYKHPDYKNGPGIVFKRYFTFNFALMILQFWVWPLSRYLPKEEGDEPDTVSD